MCKHIYNPDQTYPEGTPFTYLISWSELNISYYGVRYSKDCHPDDLWNNYFTSSIPVEEFRKLNGEPNIIKVDFTYDSGSEARASEEYFIRNNNCVKDPKWLNLCNGGEDYCCTGHSEESKKKMSESRKGNIHTEETKQKIRDANIGNKLSEETKQKISDANLGRKQSEEQKQKHSDYMTGRTLSEETKQKIGNAHRGKNFSDETKQLLSDSITGRIKINNGINEKCIKPEFLQEHLDLGWLNGQLPRSKEVLEKFAICNKGRIRINNGIQEKLIFPEFLQEHLDLGWVTGRLPVSEKSKQKNSENRRGKFHITNGIIDLFVSPEEAEIIYHFGFIKTKFSSF